MSDDQSLRSAAADAGLAERWLSKLGLTPAYRRSQTSDEQPSDPFAMVPDLPPMPPARGERRRWGGHTANIETGRLWAATTAQTQGLYPFPAPAGTMVRGVPFGRHIFTNEPIGLDPAQWLRDGLVTNTGLWVQGQPGVGKSSAAKRLLVGLVAYGFVGVIPGDLKDEYTPVVNALGGQVFRVGRGLHALNPLDLGPLRSAIAAAVGTDRDQLVAASRGRRLDLVESLITIVGGQASTATERLVLAKALDIAEAAHTRHRLGDPTIPELVAVIEQGGDELRKVLAVDNDHEYAYAIHEFRNTLVLMVEGPIRGMFDRPSSFSVDADTPAVSLSLRAIRDDGDDVVAASMMCAWAWSAALIEAAHVSGVRRNVFQIQDELWRALRVAPGLVEKSDRITRLNRDEGTVSLQSTHSLTDLEALPTEADRAKARGMAARNAIQLFGGLDNAELERLHRIFPFSSRERELLSRWSAPPTWVRGQRHPGRGRYLVKSGGRMGLPVAVDLIPEELALYDTDTAFADITPKGQK
ncbi:hypothetical protein [Nocardia alni]|uniref:hypothetical protein n=1 Tax=Nocardia alni TaxID=2815723 RepID=UPI001C22CA9E|nr:hypothetical protein [Nocardia alni]